MLALNAAGKYGEAGIARTERNPVSDVLVYRVPNNRVTLATMIESVTVRCMRPVVLVVLLANGAAVLAQNGVKPRAKVLLYRERMAQQFDTVDVVKNALKLNPLLFMRGEIPLYYERALSNRLSMQVGIGMTWRNYINFNLDADEVDDFGEGTKIIAKPSYHIAARYYFSDDLEQAGPYMELEFAHLDYVKDIAMKDSLRQLTDQKFRDTRTFNDLRLLFGHQSLSATSNWLVDFYGGIGLRDRRMIIVQESFHPGSSPQDPSRYTYTTKAEDDIVPVLFLGVRVGLGF